MATEDPWKNLRKATTAAPAAAPAQAGGGDGLLASLFGGRGGGSSSLPRLGLLGGNEGDFIDMLRQLGPALLMLDPQTQNAGTMLAGLQGQRREARTAKQSKNETAQWLMSEGVGAGEAAFLTSNPTALNSWYNAWKTSGTPDWQIHELFNADGEPQKFMIDMKTGNMSPLGGSKAKTPNVSIETIYDEKTGKERKVLFNKDTNQIVLELGGTKSDLMSEEEFNQQLELRAAGAPKTTIDTGAKQETKEAEGVGTYFSEVFKSSQEDERAAHKTLGTLSLLEQAAKSEGFVSGGGGQFILQMKKLAKTFGYDVEGLTETELFDTQAKALLLDSMGSLGTAVSDADRRFYEGSLPSLGTSRGGNLAAIEMIRAVEKRKIEIGKMARDYRKRNGKIDEGFGDEIATFMEENPIFTPELQAKITEIAKDQTRPGGGGSGAAGATGGDPNELVEVPGSPGVFMKRGELENSGLLSVEPPAVPAVKAPAVEPPAVQPVVPAQPQPKRITPRGVF